MPLKSVAIALLFAVVLGPVGVLYSSVMGGTILIVLGFVVVSSQYMVPIILLWLVSCIWSVAATNRYNKKVIRGSLLVS